MEKISSKIQELEKRLETATGSEAVRLMKSIVFAKAQIIACEAVLRWAKRYSARAKELAEKETDPSKRDQYLKIAQVCERVPENPPSTFWEALQSYWFITLVRGVIESQGLAHSSGRWDLLFWPYYEKDVIKEKTISREFATRLVANLWLKFSEIGRPARLVGKRSAVQGVADVSVVTLGGVKEDGSDACNELTLVCLDVVDALRLNFPDIKLRWHPRMSREVFKRACEVIRSGLGMPSIKNDPVTISKLMECYGFNIEEARSWAIMGCAEVSPTIHSKGSPIRETWTVNIAKCLELALFNGRDPDPNVDVTSIETGDPLTFKDFDQLFEAFRRQFLFMCGWAARIKCLSNELVAENIKRPFTSALFKESLEKSVDILELWEQTIPIFNAPGTVDVIDSLVAIKYNVFDKKKYTMAQLLEALRSDWEGYEEMRRDFINAPKFGNNDPYADEIAIKVYKLLSDEVRKYCKDNKNRGYTPILVPVTWMFLWRDVIGALPNGRRRGDPMADGGSNPHAGFDRSGLWKALLSASKIDYAKFNACVYNAKLNRSIIEGEAGLRKFMNLIESAFNLGLDMIQFNIVSTDTLKDAQQHPERYEDLVVRVAGYCAYFTKLPKFVQDAIICRTEFAAI